MRQLGDRVFVEPDTPATETASGIALVEDWPQETSGTVTGIGGQVRDVRVGDRVVFAPSAGQEMQINRQRLFVLRERDVIATLEGTHE